MLHINAFVFRTIALFAMLLVYDSSPASAYWDVELPVMEGATEVSPSRDEAFSVISLNYELQIQDPAQVRNFYDDYFKGLGWKNTLQSKPRSFVGEQSSLGSWSGQQMTFTNEGEPLVIYVASWKPQDIPATAVLNIRLTGYSGEQFASAITVQISPDPDPVILYRLNDLLGNDPENLFKLHEAVQGNPFEIHNLSIDKIPPHLESDPLIVEFLSIVEALQKEYSEFHQLYNQ